MIITDLTSIFQQQRREYIKQYELEIKNIESKINEQTKKLKQEYCNGCKTSFGYLSNFVNNRFECVLCKYIYCLKCIRNKLCSNCAESGRRYFSRQRFRQHQFDIILNPVVGFYLNSRSMDKQINGLIEIYLEKTLKLIQINVTNGNVLVEGRDCCDNIVDLYNSVSKVEQEISQSLNIYKKINQSDSKIRTNELVMAIQDHNMINMKSSKKWIQKIKINLIQSEVAVLNSIMVVFCSLKKDLTKYCFTMIIISYISQCQGYVESDIRQRLILIELPKAKNQILKLSLKSTQKVICTEVLKILEPIIKIVQQYRSINIFSDTMYGLTLLETRLGHVIKQL